MAVIVKNLKECILNNAKESDKVVIISGYFSPDIIEEIAKLNVSFTFYYGMYAIDKISDIVYRKMKSIDTSNGNLTLKFVNTQRVHTKCYLFYKDEMICNAMVGSANCSVQGLCSPENSEMLIELNSNVLKEMDYLIRLEQYYNKIDKMSLDIGDPKIKTFTKKFRILKNNNKKSRVPVTNDPLVAIMPLYKMSKNGKKMTYCGAGPNWGNQKGNTATKQDAMESYIPILAEHLDKYPLLFQAYPVCRKTTGGKTTRRSDPVTVIWDDGEMMTMTFQGSQREYPSKKNPLMVYPKQLTYGGDSSKKGGAVLGAYLRKRMNVDPFHVITVKDLKKYGRDHIVLTYISSGLYQADFSGRPLP